MYIIEKEQPSYTTICDRINRYSIPYQYKIFTMVTKTIIEEFNLDITNQYLDGTKIEANANKYKFVWKPTTFHKKFDIKIKEYVIMENIDINYISTEKGRCLNKKQKNYKLAYQYLIKLLEYEEKERICGKNRNSYFKRIKMQQQWC